MVFLHSHRIADSREAHREESLPEQHLHGDALQPRGELPKLGKLLLRVARQPEFIWRSCDRNLKVTQPIAISDVRVHELVEQVENAK